MLILKHRALPSTYFHGREHCLVRMHCSSILTQLVVVIQILEGPAGCVDWRRHWAVHGVSLSALSDWRSGVSTAAWQIAQVGYGESETD